MIDAQAGIELVHVWVELWCAVVHSYHVYDWRQAELWQVLVWNDMLQPHSLEPENVTAQLAAAMCLLCKCSVIDICTATTVTGPMNRQYMDVVQYVQMWWSIYRSSTVWIIPTVLMLHINAMFCYIKVFARLLLSLSVKIDWNILLYIYWLSAIVMINGRFMSVILIESVLLDVCLVLLNNYCDRP